MINGVLGSEREYRRGDLFPPVPIAAGGSGNFSPIRHGGEDFRVGQQVVTDGSLRRSPCSISR